MPKGIKGFQKGHYSYKGVEKGWFKKGQETWNKNKKLPELSKENSPQWKGEKAKITAKHMWIYEHWGKANRCENPNCKYPRKNRWGFIKTKPSKFEWANVSGKYLRERKDWIRLCNSCHQSWDRGLIEILGIKKIYKQKLNFRWQNQKALENY